MNHLSKYSVDSILTPGRATMCRPNLPETAKSSTSRWRCLNRACGQGQSSHRDGPQLLTVLRGADNHIRQIAAVRREAVID